MTADATLDDSPGRTRVAELLDRASFAVLVAGSALVPLWFWPFVDSVFVRPKFELMRLLTTAGALAAGGWLVLRRPRLGLLASDVAILVFVALNTLAFVFSVDRRISLYGEPLQRAGLVTVYGLAGVYWIARLTVRDVARLRTLVVAACTAATGVAAYGAIQLAGADPVWMTIPGDRVFSTIGQPNWLAAYLVMALPLTAALTSTATSAAGRVIGMGSLAVQFAVLVATRSRSAYLGLLVVIVVGTLLAARHRSGSRTAPIRGVVLAVTAVALGATLLVGLGRANPTIAPSAIAERAVSAADVGGFDAQRYVSLWKVGASITLDRPWIGTGPDTYATVFPHYRDRVLDPTYAEHFSQYRPESPHNVYLSISAGAGVPATLCYLAAVILALLRLGLQSGASPVPPALRAGVTAALVGHLVTDWFMTPDLSGAWLFWALIGGSLSCLRRAPVLEQTV